VRAAVDIYYMRYHMILNDIADGHGAEREREVLGTAHGHLIEPMPAIGLFLATLKGRIGAQMGNFAEQLLEMLRARGIAGDWSDTAGYARRLAAVGRYLEAHPAPVAVVTSSIAYEARVVLGAVFGLLREEVAGWPVDDATKAQILQDFQDPEAFYDAFITASDSSEIRLKPHRDLYSIALQTLGLGHEDFPCVIGFEDSESGVTAIRAGAWVCPWRSPSPTRRATTWTQRPGSCPASCRKSCWAKTVSSIRQSCRPLKKESERKQGTASFRTTKYTKTAFFRVFRVFRG
jgi:hypothetical protein